MSRKKASTTMSKQPAKKVSKRNAKTQLESVDEAADEKRVVDIAHEASMSAAHEEAREAIVVTEEIHSTQASLVEETHETTQSEHVKQDILPSHDDAANVKSGVLSSIIAFKQSNEMQFYGIIGLAVFVLILIL